MKSLKQSLTKLLMLLASIFIISMIASCEEDEILNGNKDENDNIGVPTDTVSKPVVILEEAEKTETSLSFTLIPQNATSVSYILLEKEQELTAEQLFALPDNTPADATQKRTYTFNNLKEYATYTIAAAARNNKDYSEVAKLTMQTVMPAATLNLAIGHLTDHSASFAVKSTHVKDVVYLCLKTTETAPDAATILSTGTKIKANVEDSVFVESLEPSTEYQVLAVATDLANQPSTEIQKLTFTTLEKEAEKILPPEIGDFYYSDGTWSTKLNPNKTPIGLVFYKGIADSFGDYANAYRMKDGQTKMEEIHGYVVALKDATNLNGENNEVIWSSFNNEEPTGASIEKDDFLGYTNTKSIVKAAKELRGELNANDDNYPACYYATIIYEQAVPAPETSSGWFLPSAYQFKYIYDKVYFNEEGFLLNSLENGFDILGKEVAQPLYAPDAEYWTSTEKIDAYGTSTWAHYFSFDTRSINPGFIADYRKNATMRVRSMLVF